ncbi:MAG: heavy metal translocating P-type ATPase, partial [Chitinophagaceae bacterium]
MEKTKINLDILLPQVPNERDECVSRIIESLAGKRGIDKVHVVPGEGNRKAQLCFHYDPAVISINKVEQLAKQAGADITEHYGHLLIETSGVRHPTHARIIEAQIKSLKGVSTVSVSGTGFIQLEFKKESISQEAVIEQISKSGLTIKKIEDFHVHETNKHADKKEGHDDKHEGHEHDHAKEGEAHEHAHGGIFGEKTELIFAIICGAFLAVGFGLSFIEGLSNYVSIGCYIAAYFFGGFYTTKEAIEGISKGDFEIDFLMLVAAIGAAVLGQWAEGALLLFLFSLGHALEHYAMEKARKSIAALAELAPKTALLKTGNDIKEVNIEDLKTGDVIVVKPNSKISADGIVVNGNSSVNQAPITGES